VTVAVAAALAGCGKSEPKSSGQALASVGGTEITTLQLNEEMQRANVKPEQQEAAKKQLLESLIDRQLLQNAASEEKLDRDPKVAQAIERAKALVIAQAYMQKKVGQMARPTTQEMQTYFNEHPEFFSQRKQFNMFQLILPSAAVTPEVSKAIDGVKTIDDAAAYLEAKQIKFARNQLSRTTADLPPDLSKKLLAMPKGQLFIVREGERSVLSTIVDIKDAPVTFETATPQIEQYLINTRSKEAAAAEIKRLRAASKVEYLNKSLAPSAPATPSAPAAPAAGSDAAAAARGVAGLK
jgi:EpsD family peptidyl-prolyl cis-trans isomerase